MVNMTIPTKKLALPKDSKEEARFLEQLTEYFTILDTSELEDKASLESCMATIASTIEKLWSNNAKEVTITKNSKSWWSKSCSNAVAWFRRT